MDLNLSAEFSIGFNGKGDIDVFVEDEVGNIKRTICDFTE